MLEQTCTVLLKAIVGTSIPPMIMTACLVWPVGTLKVRLDRIDLSTNSRNTLAALIKLLALHIPYSLHIPGTALNTSRHGSTLQNVDAFKVTLWTTIRSRSSPFPIWTTSPDIFSSDDSGTFDPLTAEETQGRQVVEAFTQSEYMSWHPCRRFNTPCGTSSVWAFAHAGLLLEVNHWTTLRSGDDSD